MFACACILFYFLNSEEEEEEEEGRGGKKKKNKCYIKTGLSWSASLVDCKPPSMENEQGRSGFSGPR